MNEGIYISWRIYCIYVSIPVSMRENVSQGFGIIALVCGLLQSIPQIYENWRNGSANGISYGFLISWFVGDVTNFIGCILNYQLVTQSMMAIYFIVVDVILCIQTIYYRRGMSAKQNEERINHDFIHRQSPRKNYIQYISSIGSAFAQSKLVETIPIAVDDTIVMKRGSNTYTVGAVCGWISAFLYITSRIPQIYKNFSRKSTEGLSVGMFVCTLSQNIAYSASIFIESTERSYLLQALPFIIGALGTVGFDVLIFFQFYQYRTTSADEMAIEIFSDEWSKDEGSDLDIGI